MFDSLPVDSSYLDDLLYSNLHPVVLSFIDLKGSIVSTPVWTYFHNNHFYFFSSKKSMKVRTVENGNTEFSVLLIRRDSYPVVVREELPYLSMTGTMEIITEKDEPSIHDIHIKLLEKYNSPDQDKWVVDLIGKLKEKPENTWMLRFTASKIRNY